MDDGLQIEVAGQPCVERGMLKIKKGTCLETDYRWNPDTPACLPVRIDTKTIGGIQSGQADRNTEKSGASLAQHNVGRIEGGREQDDGIPMATDDGLCRIESVISNRLS